MIHQQVDLLTRTEKIVCVQMYHIFDVYAAIAMQCWQFAFEKTFYN